MSHYLDEVIATAETGESDHETYRHWVAYATYRGGVFIVDCSDIHPSNPPIVGSSARCWWQPYDPYAGLHGTGIDPEGREILGMTEPQAQDLMASLRRDHRHRRGREAEGAAEGDAKSQ